jgi:hypothetical protein
MTEDDLALLRVPGDPQGCSLSTSIRYTQVFGPHSVILDLVNLSVDASFITNRANLVSDPRIEEMARLGTDAMTSDTDWSGRPGSNRHDQLGRLRFYH